MSGQSAVLDRRYDHHSGGADPAAVGTAPPEPPRAPEPAAPEPVLLKLSPYAAGDLPRAVPYLVYEVRDQLRRRGPASAVTIDLSAVPPTPACAPLLLLFDLVRRAVGPAAEIVVTGASPALAACLVTDLPDGVVLIDQRGRRWSA